MKKISIVLIMLMVFIMGLTTSCKKDDKPCNCGIIQNDDIEFDDSGNMFYTLTIKNDCSGNLGKYYFTYDVWLDANVGESFCVTNVSSWVAKPKGKTTIQSVDDKKIE